MTKETSFIFPLSFTTAPTIFTESLPSLPRNHQQPPRSCGHRITRVSHIAATIMNWSSPWIVVERRCRRVDQLVEDTNVDVDVDAVSQEYAANVAFLCDAMGLERRYLDLALAFSETLSFVGTSIDKSIKSSTSQTSPPQPFMLPHLNVFTSIYKKLFLLQCCIFFCWNFIVDLIH